MAPLLLLLAGAGCGFDIVSQQTLGGVAVATLVRPGTSFAAYPTFAIVDKLFLVTDDPESTTKYVDAPAVLSLVTANLEQRGFVKVAEIDPAAPPSSPPSADFAVNVIALQATRTDAAYWIAFPGYPGPSGWGYPGYDVEYPWTWPAISYQVGTLFIEILDLHDPMPGTSGDHLQALWASLSYGVAPAGTSYDAQRVLDSINRAFAQSPYLEAR